MVAYLSGWDIFALVGYFVLVIAVSLYSMFGHNRSTVHGYFLAGRKMIWVFVGASLFASNIGSEHFIGLAGSGAASGLGVGAFELNAMLVLQLLGWVFLPVFISSNVATLPEYMKKRFGGSRIRVYLSVLSLLLYILTKVSVNLYSGALFIKIALGWNLYYSVLFVLAITAFSTMTGGLAAVIYTDTLQSVIMVGGGLTLMGFSFAKMGSVENFYTRYMNAIPSFSSNSSSEYKHCGIPDPNSFKLLRGVSDTNMPWLGFILGQTPASIWYWCSDQMMVQRTLASKSLSHAQGGTLLAGYIKILPLFMMVIPGMISRVLYTETVGCADPETCMSVCGSKNGCSNIAYPMLIMNLMPTGLKGLMLAVMLAALMSDLTSIFNSASTLFTIDIYQQFKKDASNRQLMIVGRLFVLFMVAVGIAWIPIIKNMQGAQLYIYIQSIAAYLSPPIAAVYLLAILWKKANEKGAFCGLMAGMVTGIIRMILDFIWSEPACGEEDKRPAILKNFHYMYFALMLFIITCVVVVVVSLVTEKVESYRLIRTTYWTRFSKERRFDEWSNSDLDQKSQNERISRLTGIIPVENEKLQINPSNNNVAFTNSQSPLKPITESKQSIYTDNEVQYPNQTPFYKTLFKWICGFDMDRSAKPKNNDQVLQQINLHSLEQKPYEKWILNINLVFIISIAVIMYGLFSISPEKILFNQK